MRHTQLRSFHVAALAGGVTAGAAKLNISQPTLTSQIRSLEAEFGVELFVRAAGRMVLTDAGRELLRITQRLFHEEQEAEEFLRDTGALRRGHLTLGAVGPFHVTEILIAFHALYPEISVSVAIGNTEEVLKGLLEFRTDVAVLAHVDDTAPIWSTLYSRDEIVLIASSHHRFSLGNQPGVHLHELEGEPMVLRELGSNTRRATQAAFRAAGVNPRIIMEIGSREAVREAVASGAGVSTVSSAEFVPDQHVRGFRFLDCEIVNHAYVACLRERRSSRMISAFLDVVDSLRGARA